MKYINKIVILLFLVSAFSVQGQGIKRRVLFLGNSYTYENNLPHMIAQMALSVGDTLLFDSRLVGGYTLEDHSNDPISLNKIASNQWDYIVLQEQSQRPSFINPNGFLIGFMNLSDYIQEKQSCAQVTAFMTWGYKDGDLANCPTHPNVCTYSGMQQLITTRYLSIAETNQAEVTPVGVVWKYIRDNYPSLSLYQSDGSHPSLIGSYIAACCFYTSIFHKNPIFITNHQGLDNSTANLIKSVTKQLVYDQMTQWYIGKYVPDSYFSFRVENEQNEILISQHSSTFRDAYLWDFGDGTTSTLFYPSHQYVADGTYQIRLSSWRCYLGQQLESVYSRPVTFCGHTNTVFPNDLFLCPEDSGVLWTQEAESYQWVNDEEGVILGAMHQFLQVNSAGYYSVITNKNGCLEMSPSVWVDQLIVFSDCELSHVEQPASSQIHVFPNPVEDILYIHAPPSIQSLYVVNLLGQTREIKLTYSNMYEVASLASGVYLLFVVFENGAVFSTKVIKR